MSLEEIPLHLPRNAFNPRDTARAADLWRLCQDAALLGSSRRGWPPQRYRDAGCAFVVRAMTCVHHRPAVFGEPVTARTWVTTFRRGTLSDRQVRIYGDGSLVCAATQQWVHVASPALEMRRASPELEAAFPLVAMDGDGDVALPAWTPVHAPARSWAFEVWYGWMDPLAHVNHPAYVDQAEEALARALAEAGIDPHGVIAVAEAVKWRGGVVAPERITLETRLVGRTERGVATEHVFRGADGGIRAEATLVRAHAEAGGEALARALGAP